MKAFLKNLLPHLIYQLIIEFLVCMVYCLFENTERLSWLYLSEPLFILVGIGTVISVIWAIVRKNKKLTYVFPTIIFFTLTSHAILSRILKGLPLL